MAVLDRVPVAEITARARDIRLGQVLLTVLAGLLFGLGWAVAKLFTITWLAVAWCAVAVKVGWTQGRRPAGGRTRGAA